MRFQAPPVVRSGDKSDIFPAVYQFSPLLERRYDSAPRFASSIPCLSSVETCSYNRTFLPFFLLHFKHVSLTLCSSEVPPRDFGMTWSNSNSCSRSSLPHSWQV